MTASSAIIREYVQITQESAFGTIDGTITRGTNQIAIRLPGSNQQTMRANPIVQEVPYGGGFSVIKDSISDKTEIKGTLTTPLCYSQANFLLSWALQRITSAPLPWTTTEPINQFASCTLDHAIMYDDTGTFTRKRYTGVKVDAMKLEVSEESQYAVLSLDLVGSDYAGNSYDSSSDPTSGADPLPVDADFPTDFVLWIHSNGGWTLGGGARAEYTSLNVSCQNQHDVRFYANRWVQALRSFGTMFTIDSDFTLISSPDDRATYASLGALTAEVVFTNGTHTITLNFFSNNRIKGLTDELPVGKIYGRKLSLENRYDSTNSNWFSFTFA